MKYIPQLIETELREASRESSVQDTGIGIAGKDQEHIFETFYQVQGGIDPFGGWKTGMDQLLVQSSNGRAHPQALCKIFFHF